MKSWIGASVYSLLLALLAHFTKQEEWTVFQFILITCVFAIYLEMK